MTQAESPITVAIVEDDTRIRRTLEMVLARAGDCHCLGAYRSGEDALAAIPALAPSIIIMDVNLPGMNGVETVRKLVERGVSSHILMLTVHRDTDTIFDALAAGAVGYLVKPVQSAQLLEAVHDVFGGGAPMTSSIARKVVQAFRNAPDKPKSSINLSPRENEILEMLSKGFLYKEIADKLDCSYATVRTHIERIYEKLHVHSRSQAVAKFMNR
jgi:DNA-binding NarL/FixJ family response regulator